MKLKTIALSVLLLAANYSAQAAPTLQTCSPMTITHNGDAGISYLLACDAGAWTLKYTGGVPAGTESVTARYRLKASKESGESFTINRSVRLAAPNMLGQSLIREAVSLDNGDLALRECAEANCTLYRPLGTIDKVAKATITVTPEVKRLTDESVRLAADLAKQQAAGRTQAALVADLKNEVTSLTAQLASAKEQYLKHLSSMQQAAQQVDAVAPNAVCSEEIIAGLNAQLGTAKQELDTARKAWADCQAEHEHLKSEKNKVDAQAAEQVELSNKASAEAAALKLKLEQATQAVANLQAQLDVSGRAGSEALAEVTAAREAQHLATQAAALSQVQLKNLEQALQAAQRTNESIVGEQANQVDELQAALADVKRDLAVAQAQLTNQNSRPAQGDFDAVVIQNGGLAKQVTALEESLSAAQAKLATADASIAAQEVAYAELHQAYEQNLKQLAELHVAQNKKESGDTAAAISARDAANAEVTRLRAEIATLVPQMQKLEDERITAIKGTQQMAKDTLEALDQIQELQEEKEDAAKTIASSTNKLMESAAKLEAANLARELAMQALSAAHADADAQNIKNQELSTQLNKALAKNGSQQQTITELEKLAESQANELAQLRQKLSERDIPGETSQAQRASH